MGGYPSGNTVRIEIPFALSLSKRFDKLSANGV